MLGETIACATVSPHQCMVSYKQVHCCSPLQKLPSDFGDFNDRVCHIMKFTSSCHEVYYYCHIMKFTSSCHEVYYYSHVMTFTIAVVKFTIVVMELATAVMKLTIAAMMLTIVVMKLTMAIMKLTITVMTLTIAVMKFTIAEHNPYMRLFTMTNILLLPTLAR